MQNLNNYEKVFLEIGFRSPERDGIRTIELFGVPGEKLRNGKCIVSNKVERFFDDLLVRKIFRESRRLPDCDFQSLKVWLYDLDIANDERGYVIPNIDSQDLEIRSNFSSSKLERIYVLDNQLKGAEYQRWKKNAEDLFIPLFSEFIAPPEPPSILADNPFVKLIEAMTDSIDNYGKLRKKLFFNALIIQID
ncbi:MAG: hypothetical protein U7127_00295 [Phormidium sp.]